MCRVHPCNMKLKVIKLKRFTWDGNKILFLNRARRLNKSCIWKVRKRSTENFVYDLSVVAHSHLLGVSFLSSNTNQNVNILLSILSSVVDHVLLLLESERILHVIQVRFIGGKKGSKDNERLGLDWAFNKQQLKEDLATFLWLFHVDRERIVTLCCNLLKSNCSHFTNCSNKKWDNVPRFSFLDNIVLRILFNPLSIDCSIDGTNFMIIRERITRL